MQLLQGLELEQGGGQQLEEGFSFTQLVYSHSYIHKQDFKLKKKHWLANLGLEQVQAEEVQVLLQVVQGLVQGQEILFLASLLFFLASCL